MAVEWKMDFNTDANGTSVWSCAISPGSSVTQIGNYSGTFEKHSGGNPEAYMTHTQVGTASGYISPQLSSADCYGEVDMRVAVGSSLNFPNIFLRRQSVANTENCYRYRPTGTQTSELIKYVGGSYTQLASGGVGAIWTNNTTHHAVRLECDGTTLTGFLSGIQACTATDSSHSAVGYSSFAIEGNKNVASYHDYIEFGTLSAGTAIEAATIFALTQEIENTSDVVFETSTAFDLTQEIENTNDTIFESEATFNFTQEIENTSDVVLEAEAIFTSSLDNIFDATGIFSSVITDNIVNDDSTVVGIIMEVAVAFANELATVYDSDTVIEAALSIVQELASSYENVADLQASLSLAIGQDYSSISEAVLEAAVSLAKELTASYTSDIGAVTIEAAMSLGIEHSILQTVQAIFNAATTFVSAQGLTDQNNAILGASQSLGIEHSIDFDNIATLEASVSVGIEQDYGTTATINVAEIEAALSLGLTQDYTTVNGPNIWEPTINVGLVQTISSISVANLYAATTLQNELAYTVNGGNVIDTAINYAIEHDDVYVVDISIEGSISAAITQAMTPTSEISLEASTLFTHQVGLQSVAQAILNAGLNLSSIKDMTTDGSILSLTIELPCGRTLLVQIENRTLTIQTENRTLTIGPENRTTTISGCN